VTVRREAARPAFEAVAALVIKAEAASAFEGAHDGRAKLLSDPEATI
jgi:hypothetical protein